MTLSKTHLAGPVIVTILGIAGSSGGLAPISAPGVKVGDRLLTVMLNRPSGVSQQGIGSFVESVVSVADQIQPLDASDLSTATLDVFLVRLP